MGPRTSGGGAEGALRGRGGWLTRRQRVAARVEEVDLVGLEEELGLAPHAHPGVRIEARDRASLLARRTRQLARSGVLCELAQLLRLHGVAPHLEVRVELRAHRLE